MKPVYTFVRFLLVLGAAALLTTACSCRVETSFKSTPIERPDDGKEAK